MKIKHACIAIVCVLLLTGCSSRTVTVERSLTTYDEAGTPTETETYVVTYDNSGNETKFGNMEFTTPSGWFFKLDNYSSQDLALRTTSEALKAVIAAGAAGGVLTGGVPVPVPVPVP